MSQDLVSEARALLAKATPRPWHWGPADPERCEEELESPTGDDALWSCGTHRVLTDGSARGEYSPDIDVCGSDAALIARAPTMISAMADEIERLRKHVADIEHDFNESTRQCNEEHGS